MTIQKIIVHQLEYSAETTALTAKPSNHSLQPTPALETMLADLQQTFNKKPDKRYGQFHGGNGNNFTSWLEQYINDSMDYTEFTTQTLEKLKESLNQAGAQGGGYVLLADYKQGLSRYFLLCMLTHHASVTVTQDLNITDCSYLDTTRMPLACRININEWQKNPLSNRYLSFVRPRTGHRLSDVFQQALGCTETSGSKEETVTLLSAVDDYCKETASSEDRKTVKKQVHDYCQNKLSDGEDISLSELTGHITESGSDDFARFVNTSDYDMTLPITLERRTLTKLIRYSGSSKGLNLSFNAELLGSQIRYDKDSGQLIITELPEKLKEQLQKA
ncbi:MAG: nucleoid-associated protein [Candidatus Endonucleobacter bathymodioli]|uniref:Nucleoid-associated protein n=1 Tax=Candidatus Endonucleibacter bathymodioli TaxID=539814 RepID=A0AA90NVR4_9GAMM|nr:nucleoid-associated protein [Candidatus Endonucleobacter bathymodioli]